MLSVGTFRNDILEATAVLAENQGFEVAVEISTKGTMIAGVATVVGALLAGRAGMIAGAAIGSIGAAAVTNDFNCVGYMIRQGLTRAQRNALCDFIISAVKAVVVNATLDKISSLIVGNSAVMQTVLKVLTIFFKSQFNMIANY